MTYRELFYKATRLIDKGEITLGEYDEMTKPLDRDIEQEPICDRDCEHCTWTECPIEPCDDAISHEDKKHIDGFKYWCETNEENGTITIPKFVCDEIVKLLDDLPPVTQKSVKWIEERDKEHGISKFTCSQCGNVISDIRDRITFYTFNRFCGRCGAKMVEPQESEEV